MLKIRNLMPQFIFTRLWGDRIRWGRIPFTNDPCWMEWEKVKKRFYTTTQRKGVGKIVNDCGYSVMSQIDLEGKCVLEFGPGNMRHHKFWNKKPSKYILADIHKDMMTEAKSVFRKQNIQFDSFLMERNQKLPLERNSVDVIVSFYSLEHLYPLEDYLNDMKYYLRPDGIIVGAIPTEGGLLWALGRFFTSRRWLHRNTNINYDKLICWEHPNYADYVIKKLDQNFQRIFLKSWPFSGLPNLDFNLTFSFCYKNCIR